MKSIFTRLGVASLTIVAGTICYGQGLTGSLHFTIRDTSGRPMAGVRIEIKSERLIGNRVGITDANGVFRAPLLPPGTYSATAIKEGFKTAGITSTVPLGGTTSAEAILKPTETVGAVVEVIASNNKLDKSEIAAKENYAAEDMTKLPVARTLDGVALLSPGTTMNASGNTIIAGAASYENKYLVNGTDVNDPYFNNAMALYIEDAVEETQVIANGVSSEHGRFMGGIINAITRRGGNDFSGSFRSTMTNTAWNAVRPMQDRRGIVDFINKVHTVTVGGPILKDKLWFFAAGRYTKSEQTLALPISGVQYNQPAEQKRWELNLTFQPNADHRINIGHTSFVQETTNSASLLSAGVTPETLRDRRSPHSISSVTYDWIISPQINISVLGTEKKQRFEYKLHNQSRTFDASPVFDADGYLYHNAYFNDDPEDRNNRNLKVVFNSFLDAFGSHELKAGYEFFEEINTATNGQSPTGYLIFASNSFDTFPKPWSNATFDFDSASASLNDYTKAPGGTFHSKYHSLFINDNWKVNNHWNFQIGFRYDSWKGDKNAGFIGPDVKTLVPRLGINYDINGDGIWQAGATYAQYAGKMNTAITQAGTYVGNPALYIYGYTGPSVTGILPGPNSPGFRRSDYDTTPFYVSDSTLNTIIDPNLKAPLTYEYTFNLKHKISDTGVFTMSYVYRNNTRMFEDFIGDEGSVNIQGNKFSVIRWANMDNRGERKYKAIMASYQNRADMFTGIFNYSANITVSRLWGNYDSDGANAPGGGTNIGNYEKAWVNANTKGYLPTDEPVRLKAFGSWTKAIGMVGNLSLSTVLDLSSGQPYSHTQTILMSKTYSSQYPQYVDLAQQNYTRIYGVRGNGRYAPQLFVDLAAEWVGTLGVKNLNYFVKGTLFNVMNYIQLATWDVRGQTYVDPLLPDGKPNPAASQFTGRKTFGNPVSQNNYIGNRRVQLEVGLRF